MLARLQIRASEAVEPLRRYAVEPLRR